MSAPSVSAMEENSGASEEVEALKSIYIRELKVTLCESSNAPSCISINLHPATADNTNEQYVCLTLVINLPPNYPHDLPEIVIRNPRGLSDEDLERIKGDLHLKASESKGNAMLFELIELAKEHLTVGNTPRCSCAICLYTFSEQDVFTKTGCYHYFHSHCLSRYVEYMREELVVAHPLAQDTTPEVKVLCPVCREPIAYDDSEASEAAPPPPVLSECSLSFEPDSELIQLQQRMAELFMKQKSQGGIIDVEAEKNKYLLEISMVPSDAANVGGVAHNSRPLTQAGGRKKRLQRKPRDADGLPSQDDRQVSPRQPKSAVSRQEGRGSRQGYLNNRTERYPASERGVGAARRGRGGFHSSDGAADRRQQNHVGRGGPRPKMDGNSEPSPKPTTESSAVTSLERPSCEAATLESEPGDFKTETAVDDCSAQRPNARRGGSRGANVSARSNYGYRREGGARGQRHPQAGTVGVEREGGAADEGTCADWAAEVEGQRRGAGRPRRPYDRRLEGRRDDDAGTNQDSYRARTNNRYRRGGGGNGRWNDRSRRSSDQSDNRGHEEGKRSDGERCGPKSESLPVSHLMVLTGPPTKAFNAVSIGGCDAESNPPPLPPAIKSVGELPDPDSTQSLSAKDSSVRFCASLPPGFKSRSQHFTPPPPAGSETAA